jgi:hypothetical protein
VNAGPVFVAGLADSGKTPLTRMLNDRTSIVISRHTQLWRRFGGGPGSPIPTGRLEPFLQDLLVDPGVASLRPDVDRLRSSLAAHTVTRSGILAALHEHHAEEMGKRRWGEQCGLLDTYADRLLRDLPTARVVHLVRDPAVSYRITTARSGGRAGRLGRFAARWAASVERALDHQRRFPDRYLVLRFERLADRTDATMREVCVFLNEPVDDLPFAFDAGSVVGNGGGKPAGKYALDAEASVRARSGGEWRFLAQHAGRQLRSVGYDDRVPVGRAEVGYLTRWPAERLVFAFSRVGATAAASR